jgi:hypothetical protein
VDVDRGVSERDGLWSLDPRCERTGTIRRNRGQTQLSLVDELVESTVQLAGAVQLRNEFGKRGKIGLKPGRVRDCAMLCPHTHERHLISPRLEAVYYAIANDLVVVTGESTTGLQHIGAH